MRSLCGFGALVLVLALVSGNLSGDDKEMPAKGQLPANWKKLNLSEEQKQKIYKIQNDCHEKTIVLEKQIKDLKEKEAADRIAVLTDEQKKHFNEVLLGKGVPETTPKDDKKTADKTEKKDGEKKAMEK